MCVDHCPVGTNALELIDNRIVVHIPEGEYAVSPGQACVFYERPGPGARLLGGGFIARREAGRAAQRLPESVSAIT